MTFWQDPSHVWLALAVFACGNAAAAVLYTAIVRILLRGHEQWEADAQARLLSTVRESIDGSERHIGRFVQTVSRLSTQAEEHERRIQRLELAKDDPGAAGRK